MGGQHVHGLQRAEGDGRGGRDGRTVDGPRVGIHAAGRVDGEHRDPAAVRDGDELGRGRAQRPAPGEADDAVEDEVRTRDRRSCLGTGRDAAATGPAQGGEPLRVGPLRIEEHRGDADGAAPQLGTGPQGVAAVVARPHEQRDAPTPAVGEHRARDDGEPERGAAHQRTRRHPPQHRPFRGAYLLDREDLAHAATLAFFRPRHRDGAVVGVWSTWMSNLTSVPCTPVTVTVTP